MIFLGDRVPFQRPSQASANFVPRSLDIRMYSDVDPFPQFMPPVSAGFPSEIRLPLQAEPASGGTVAPASAPVGAFGRAGGASSPLALAQKATQALPAGLQRTGMAMASKFRGKLSAAGRVARGRNPGA